MTVDFFYDQAVISSRPPLFACGEKDLNNSLELQIWS